MGEPDYFAVLDRLVELPQGLEPHRIEAVLGVELVRNPDADTPTVQAWGLASRRAGAFEAVDLRMPAPGAGDSSVFLSVTAGAPTLLDAAAVIARYGTAFKTDLPSPRFPAGSVPVYLVYMLPWGLMSFGVTADKARRLVRFVVSSHGRGA